MLNSFLSHLIFGTSATQNETENSNLTNNNLNTITSNSNSNVNIVNNPSAILNDATTNGDNQSMKFNFIDDYRHDIDWVIVDPYYDSGNY